MSYLEKHFSNDNPESYSLLDELSFWSSHFGKILLDNIPLRKGMRILDVGCGAGFPLFEIAQRLNSISKLSGIDTSQAAVKRANWKKEQYGFHNVEVICGDAVSLPFAEKEFDLIVSNLGINNFENPKKVIEECYRTLKRPGRLCLTTNTEGHFREFYSVYETVLKELGKDDLLPVLKAQEQHRGTDESIRELLEDSRFSVVKIIRDRFHMRYLDGTAMLNSFLTVIGFLPGWRSVTPLEAEKEVFEMLEKKLNEQAEWDGELKMTVPILYVEAVK
jgi:arsenite methyltransferase